MRDHRTLKAWQEARTVVIDVVRLSQHSWRPWAAAMFSQLQRSSLSVQLNLAEGYAYGPSRSAVRFWKIALGSAVETGDLLMLLGDAGVVDQAIARRLAQKNDGVKQLIGGMLRKLRVPD
jgi:four helix bundle protein